MNKSTNKNEYLSNKSIIKGLIGFLLFRYGSLTAKQIQEKIGLKRQTTYNYLKEMMEEERIEAKYEGVESRPNLSVAYYSIKRPPVSDEEEKSLTKRYKESFNIERIKNSLDINIAALLEIKSAFNQWTNDEIDAFIRCDPKIWGFYGFTYLLTEDEYAELQIQFKELIDVLHKKWSENKDSEIHSGNVFTFTFYKAIF